MSKQFKLLIVAFTLVYVSVNVYAGMWFLINTQINGGKFYCTYKLQGSNPPITKTIEKIGICEQSLLE